MKKSTYTIQDLERYLRQKNEGYTDPLMEQQIEEDDFLQTILIGLQKQMAVSKTGNIIALMNKKKQKLWLSLPPTLAAYNTKNTFPIENTANAISKFLYRQLTSWGYDLQNLRIHLLLGFNCSCIILLIVAACWLNTLHESPILVSTLDELSGYKP